MRATTINRRIHSLNSFYVWAVHHRLVAVSPLVGVRRLKTPRRIPKFLPFEDISRLLSFTGSLRRTATIRGKQIHAMISILYYLGLRREGLVNICFEHFEKLGEGEVYLHVFGKGDKQRMVPFPRPAFQAYENYVRFRPECPTPRVFVSLRNRLPLSKFDVNSVCDQLTRKVRLSKKLTPHLLRHTFATFGVYETSILWRGFSVSEQAETWPRAILLQGVVEGVGWHERETRCIKDSMLP